jgi:hypothetical protein
MLTIESASDVLGRELGKSRVADDASTCAKKYQKQD